MCRPMSRVATQRDSPNAVSRNRVPFGQSMRTSSARTSHAAPNPNVTTRAQVSPAIQATLGSSPFSTATPSEGSTRTIHAFSSRVTSSVPRLR